MEQRTQEWIEMRKTKIGSSDAPVIMGISPWKTPIQLYEEKVNGDTQIISCAMQRGIDLEEKALKKFEEMTGICMFPSVIINKERDWQMASLDGISLEGNNIVEIKCSGKKTHEMAINGKIPDHYICQIQHQMSVVDAESAFYFSFDGKEGKIIEVTRDDKFIDNLLLKEKEFWDNMIQKIPPLSYEKDIQKMELDEWDNLAEEYKHILTLEKRKDEIRKRLIEISDNKDSCGNGILVQRKKRTGSVDYSSVPELFQVDLTKYRKPSLEYWEISLEK